MTISQGGTGSGASGPAVRNIYDALYGVSDDGVINKKNALLPTPLKNLPKIQADGSIIGPKVSKDPAKDQQKYQKPAENADGTPVENAAANPDGDATDPGGAQQTGATLPSPEAGNRQTRRRRRPSRAGRRKCT
jgi:penicillin-binding protein 2